MDIARAAIERMHLREVALAAHYNGLAADIQALAHANAEVEQAKYDARREMLVSDFGLPPAKQFKSFAFSNGIGILPVSGTLINRFNSSYGFITGYNFIRSQLQAMLNDDDVKGIVGDFNTFGGEAAGCFECAQAIYEMRGKKPMLAVVDSNCYSAGYALASAFDEIIVTPSGGAGSIGVVAMHVSLEKAIDEMGIKITLLHAGKHKVDGNMFEDLSPEVKADIQKGINKSYAAFVGLVAQNRDMSTEKVRGTEARIYRADDALEIGLIDGIATPSAALQVFFNELNGSDTEDKAMPISKEEQDRINAEMATARQEAAAQASADARTAERARVSGILNHAEAKDRPKMAQHLAMSTEMSVEEAGKLLAVAGKEVAPAAAAAPTAQPTQQPNRFDQSMNANGGPGVGADNLGGEGNGQEDNGPDAQANRILADQEAFTGVRLVGGKEQRRA